MSGDAANDAALMEVIHAQGWSKKQQYMTKREAEKVTDLKQVFKGNTRITNFDALQYFTQLKSISNNAFYQCSELKSVIIPKRASVLEHRSFGGCTSLSNCIMHDGITTFGNESLLRVPATNLFLPSKTTTIGNNAFDSTELSGEIIIDAKFTSIGTGAFRNTKITKVTITEDCILTSIPNTCFYDTKTLKEVVLSSKVEKIGKDSFNKTILEKINTDRIKIIGDSAFASSKVKEFNFISTESIGKSVFYNTPLQSAILNEGLKTIGDRAFNITALTEIHIPSTVTSIGVAAFKDTGRGKLVSITVHEDNPVYDSRENCNAIIETQTNTLLFGCKNTIIPEGVVAIAGNAFYYQTGLSSVIFPSTLTDILDNPFPYITIRSATFKSITPPNMPAAMTMVYATFYVPAESIDVYKAHIWFSQYADKIYAIQ